MQNWILTRILKWVGGKFDGKKTLIGGICSIIAGVLGIVGIMFPTIKYLDLTLEQAITFIVAGFTALGIGGKIQKQTNVLETKGQKPIRKK